MTGLHNMLAFVNQAFGGDSPVMKKLINEIKINCHTTDFIKKYGSDEFYAYAREPVQQPTYNDLYDLNLTDCLKEEEEVF